MGQSTRRAERFLTIRQPACPAGVPIQTISVINRANARAFWSGQPYGLVWNSGSPWPAWSVVFSHEVVEMLVNPMTGWDVYRDGTGQMIEVADPVEAHAYRLDGVFVTDFVTPAWFAGGTVGDPICQGITCTFPGPLLASADAPGPYDERGVVTRPWHAETSGDGLSGVRGKSGCRRVRARAQSGRMMLYVSEQGSERSGP